MEIIGESMGSENSCSTIFFLFPNEKEPHPLPKHSLKVYHHGQIAS
jgi:hypothetical protein